jgi:hypothetical protein
VAAFWVASAENAKEFAHSDRVAANKIDAETIE